MLNEGRSEQGTSIMPEVVDIAPIPSPVAWRADEMRDGSRWIHELSTSDIANIERGLANVKTRGLAIPFAADDFPVGALAERIASIRHDLEHGTGVALVRGLDVDKYGLDDVKLIYWGLGAHIGNGLAQSPRGEAVIDVIDTGADMYKNPTVRAFHTKQKLSFHNDQGDVVGLLCYRHAKSGGLSRIVSSAAIHNEIVATRPDLARILYQPFYHDVRGEEPKGRKPYYAEPRFAVFKGRFYGQHSPNYVRSAQRFPEVPRLQPEQLEAMDLIDTLCNEPRFQLDMDFRRGDIQFLNNHNVLHSRTEYEDFPDPGQKRHLLRLWLMTPRFSDIPPFLVQRYEDMESWKRHPLAA
jgi:hypothetical protein